MSDDPIVVPDHNITVLPKDGTFEFRDGQIFDRVSGDIISIHNLSTDAAFSALGSALDKFHDEVKTIGWQAFRYIHDAIELAVDRQNTRVGRPKNLSDNMTYTAAYENLAKHCKRWSASTIKKYHLTYRAGLKNYGDRRRDLESMACDPMLAMPILLSAIDQHQKNDLLSRANAGEFRTVQSVRAAIRQFSTHPITNIKLQETTHWNFDFYDPRFGIEGFLGRTPAGISYNIISHFTSEGGVCYFPYFGSGTEGDVSRMLKRPYYGWDVRFNADVEVRHKEVNPTTGEMFCSYFQCDSLKPWEVDSNSADLAFADPDSCYAGNDCVDEANKLAIMAEHAYKALSVGGRFAILLRRPTVTLRETSIPLQDVNAGLHTSCFSKLFDPLVRIAVTTPDCHNSTGGNPGRFTCGFHDIYVYEKH